MARRAGDGGAGGRSAAVATAERPDLLERLYARWGLRYIALIIGWTFLGGIVGCVLVAIVAVRVLNRSFPPPFEVVLLGEAGVVLGLGAAYGFALREALPFVRWVRDGRPAPTAAAAWWSVVTAPRRMLPRAYGLVSLLTIPAEVEMMNLSDLGGGEFPVVWLGVQLGIAVVAVYMYFIGETMIRPLAKDASALAPELFASHRPRSRVQRKVLLALAITTAFAVPTTQAFGLGGHSTESRLLGVLALAFGLAATFTPLLIRVIADSVVGPVKSLIAGTERVAAGDLGHPVPVTTDDEVGVLAASFNQMLEGLRERATLQAELRASRGRIVAAADAERRRVERDLHDGAQQQIVLIRLKLGLAQRLIEADPSAAAALHDELRADLDRALTELRDLARGLYPAILEGEGLRGALADAAARAPVPTTVDCDGARRYPPELEAAVYFCCLEALQNAAKHAGDGARAEISLTERDGALRFEIGDDGQGFDETRAAPGAGLQNMTDRIGALGGELRIDAGPGRGTTIAGTIPVRDR